MIATIWIFALPHLGEKISVDTPVGNRIEGLAVQISSRFQDVRRYRARTRCRGRPLIREFTVEALREEGHDVIQSRRMADR